MGAKLKPTKDFLNKIAEGGIEKAGGLYGTGFKITQLTEGIAIAIIGEKGLPISEGVVPMTVGDSAVLTGIKFELNLRLT